MKRQETGGNFIGLFLRLVLCGMICLLLAGCRKSAAGQSGAGAQQDAPEQIWYLNGDRTSLLPVEFTPTAEGTEGRISEVLNALKNPPDPKLAAVTDGFTVTSFVLGDGQVTLQLSGDYALLDPTTEVLTRAAIVSSLTEIDGVDAAAFYLAGEPLTDENGRAVGVMTADSFINNSGSEIQNYEKTRLHLYFADSGGEHLVHAYRNKIYNSNVSLERVVVEEVLKGPNSEVVFPTLNPDARIVSVTTRDGVCYVNFDQAFLSEPYSVTPQVAVYSLVNSLTELASVDSVQITVDGKPTAKFMETVSLQSPLRSNPGLVEN